MDKDCGVKQNDLLNDESGCGMKLNTLAKEHNNANDGDCSKTETDWIKPKKSVPITCFFKKCKNQEDDAKVNNENDMLIEKCDDEEEEDEEMKHYEMKGEGLEENTMKMK